MSDPILSRQSIAADAELAAAFYLLGGVKPKNQHEEGTDAFVCWETAFKRYVEAHTAPEGTEGGA